MGNLKGHILPGSFFTLFSLWWTWNVYRRYHISRRQTTIRHESVGSRSCVRYKSTSTFPCPCSKLPLESIIKVTACVIGIIGEFIFGFENGHFTHINNIQHMTMYFFFGLNGVIEIMHHYKMPIPTDLDYASGILAFGMEALLFYHHLDDREPMDVQVHMLLFYAVVCIVVSGAFEMRYRYNVLPALARIYFTLLQGTWFIQIGFILYPPFGNKWDLNSHKQMMIVTLLFAVHCALNFIFLLVIGICIYHRVKLMDNSTAYQNLTQYSIDELDFSDRVEETVEYVKKNNSGQENSFSDRTRTFSIDSDEHEL